MSRGLKGIGTALIQILINEAALSQIKRIKVVTTNDNLNALKFYQKKGFVLVAVHPNALDQSRKYKKIPIIGENGIPIRDEIELEYVLIGED